MFDLGRLSGSHVIRPEVPILYCEWINMHRNNSKSLMSSNKKITVTWVTLVPRQPN